MITHFMEMVDTVSTCGVLIIKKETDITLCYPNLGYFFSSYAAKHFPYGIFSAQLHFLRDSQICESSAHVMMKFTHTVCVAIVKGHRSQQVSLVCVLFTAL